MSQSVLIFGFFSLSNGVRHTQTNQRTRRKFAYFTYDTEIMGKNDMGAEAELRVFPGASVSQPPLPDNTIVILWGRAAIFPAPSPAEPPPRALIDVVAMSVFEGNPSDPSYEDHIPPFLPVIISTGHVIPQSDHTDGKLKAFRIATSEYVRDATMPFEIQPFYDTSIPRWANAPVPFANSCVEVAGVFSHFITSPPCFAMRVDHVTLNLGPLNQTQDPNNAGPPPGDDGSPSKKRKFRSAGRSASSTQLQPAATPPPASSTPSALIQSAIVAQVSDQFNDVVMVPATSVLSHPQVPSLPILPPSLLPPSALGPMTPAATAQMASLPVLPPSSLGPPVSGVPQSPAMLSLPGPTSQAGPRSSSRQPTLRAVAGPSRPRPAPTPPQQSPQPLVESNVLPPLAALGGSNIPLGSPMIPQGLATTLNGLTINEPVSNLSARQRGKRPDNYVNPDLN
ncbi:hypothetical protein FRB99_008661 [Tulasnella sp. 403]|nr:hypothetical protein FRB99_008661 [Tulasnella sp. 403]